MTTSSQTKLLGIFGNPLAHTLSPKMHSYFAEKTGKDVTYLAFEVEKEDFKPSVLQAKTMGALGFNITSPYKIDVLDVVDVLDAEAKRMGSVNTIVNREGKWCGYNTDGDGFVDSYERILGSFQKKDVLMLGAGGSARSIAYKLAQKGAGSVTISSRTKEKILPIEDLVKEYTKFYACEEIDTDKQYDIVINLTPLGMHPHEEENPFNKYMDMITDKTLCCDLIYNPKKTRFLQEAEAKGAKIMNGLPMLVMQGIYAFELFCDCKLPEECFNEALALFKDFRI